MNKSKIRKAVRVLGSLALGGTIASVAVLTMSGCKKKADGYAVYNGPQVTSKCDVAGNHFEPGSANFSKCCNADTTPILPMKDAICGAGQGGVAGSVANFSDAANRATTSNTQAASLEQAQNPNKDNNQLAATASTSPAAPAGAAKIAGSGLAALTTASSGSNPRAGSAGGGGGGGGGGFGTGVNTQAAGAAPGQTSATGDSANTGYSSSGGGGGARGGGSGGSGFSLDALFGGGKEGGKGGTADSANFSGRNVAEATMGTPDPDMYFSMMSREDNIFKVVERRYQSKAQQWALKDANAAQGAVSGRR